ncbi:MAG: hypothetical protein GY861_01790, partial [bacterium]|nr:hypothetical protein [bacterium]
QTIPDLNGDERFLRGSSTSGTEQPDAFQGHFHDVVPELLLNTGSAFSTGSNDTGTGGFIDTGAAITDGANGVPRTADETRPVNMSVIWIMRIK